MTVGIVNVLKPPGMTSHDVVSFMRRIYGVKRIGHAGTLDPAAAGVLPVFIGPAARLIEYATDADKAYRAELTFGYATDTADDTGAVIARAGEDRRPDTAAIEAALQSFTGHSEQIPPMHSAVKIGGKKLYELAREGVEIERQPRRVFIAAIKLVKVWDDKILFDVTCSKGTYIRSLCADIGAKTGCPAVMSFLVRTRVGPFLLAEAHTLEEIAAAPPRVLLPPDFAVRHLPVATLEAAQHKAFANGVAVSADLPDAGIFTVYGPDGSFTGIGEHRQGLLRPVKIIG